MTDEFAAAAWAKTLPLAGAAMVGDIPIRASPKAMRVAMTAIFIVFSHFTPVLLCAENCSRINSAESAALLGRMAQAQAWSREAEAQTPLTGTLPGHHPIPKEPLSTLT